MLLPVGKVNLPEATNHQLQFLLIKGREEVLRQKFIEALLQCPKLLLNALCKAEVDVQLNVLDLVCFRHCQLLSIALQLLHGNLPKGVVVDAKGNVL